MRSGADAANTWSANGEVRGLGALQCALRGRFSAYRGDRVESDLASLALGFDPWPGSHLEGSGGTRTTRDRDTGAEERVNWYGIDADVALSRRAYLTGSFEGDRGGFADSRQGSAGLAWRF